MNVSTPFFSVILPIYNVEQYLAECIDSILIQQFQNYELILVDDGSTDNSKHICEDYAKRDGRINVIHKENGGLSSARNEGIRASKGQYLIFVDSDDYLSENVFFQKAYEALVESDADVLCYGWKKINHEDRAIREERCKNVDTINQMDYELRINSLIQRDAFSISAWAHIIRLQMLKDNNCFFSEKYKSGEDIEWIFHILSACPKVVGINDTSYMYRIRKESITTQTRKPGFWRYREEAIRESINHINACKGSEFYKNSLRSCLSYMYFILLAEINFEHDTKLKTEALMRCKDLQWLARYAKNVKCKASRMILMLLGINNASKVLGSKLNGRI